MILQHNGNGLNSRWVHLSERHKEAMKSPEPLYVPHPSKLTETRELLAQHALLMNGTLAKSVRTLRMIAVILIVVCAGWVALSVLITFIVYAYNARSVDDLFATPPPIFLVYGTPSAGLLILFAVGVFVLTTPEKQKVLEKARNINEEILANCIVLRQLSGFRIGSAIFVNDELAWEAANTYQDLDAAAIEVVRTAEVLDSLRSLSVPSTLVKAEIEQMTQASKEARDTKGKLSLQLADLLDQD